MIIAKNIKLAKEGGPWDDLISTVIPEWEAAGILKLVTPPKLDGQTRSLYCEISNRYGTTTRIYLSSLEHDDDAAKLLHGRKFSLVLISEATLFKQRSLFDNAVQCLRLGEPESARQVILDCNPAPEGKEHWIYKLFWGERLAENPPEQFKTEDEKNTYREFQANLKVIEVSVADNTFLTKQEVNELFAQFSYDSTILARYFHGRWEISSLGGYFSEQFKPEIHVLGDIMSPDQSDWTTILIPESTTEMFTGWDLGDRNSVTMFACKEKDEKGQSTYSFTDEIIVESDTVLLEDYVEAVLKVMIKWEEFVGHEIQWRHNSDTSSWVQKLSAQGHEAALVEEMSRRYVVKNGLSPSLIIKLRKVDKYKGSVKDGIKLMKRLLFENRMFVSANCTRFIEMLRSFAPERSRGTGIEKVPDNYLTHRFDSGRYLVQSEEPIDLYYNRTRVGKRPGRIISLS